MTNIRTIELDRIIVEPERFQIRERLNDASIAEYTEAATVNTEFQPLRVVREDGRYYLTEGFHRHAAYKAAGITKVQCFVMDPSDYKAILDSIEMNAMHGVRMTTRDRARAVRMLVAAARAEDEDINQADLAKRWGVHPSTVGRWVAQANEAAESVEQDEEPIELHDDAPEDDEVEDDEPAPRPARQPSEPKADDPTTALVRSVNAANAAHSEVTGLISRAVNAVRALARTPLGTELELRVERVVGQLREASDIVSSTSPDEVCRACGGDKCGHCKERGWMTTDEARNWAREHDS